MKNGKENVPCERICANGVKDLSSKNVHYWWARKETDDNELYYRNECEFNERQKKSAI